MYTKEADVLIKDSKVPAGYFIMTKETRSFAIIDDDQEAQLAITKLLQDGAEVYDSLPEFFLKYPPLTTEQKKEMMMRFPFTKED